jgi:alpha-N-arabinofuranosidase
MNQTLITLHPDYQIAPVDPRIFGGFLEHLGRAVYQGVYQPESMSADQDGFRTDVLEALKRMRLTALRYPGGNFASGYHWQNGVGPLASRPSVRELAWQSIETNQFGTDEFILLARKMGWLPMFTVNLGTGSPEEARNWVEYCNSPVGTQYANMRAANGSPEPYGVKLWCLGNEMDGRWQMGHVPADQYAIRAQQAAKLMKDTDPTIELVACGSSARNVPTYMEWDRSVLEYMGEYANFVSLHCYVGNTNGNTADFLAVTNQIDQQIEEMDAGCRYVQARLRSKKRHYLCFDEWNVWYRKTTPADTNGKWQVAPHLIEEVYDLADALVVAGFLNGFIRHADVIKIANLAQIVNAIAPIQTCGEKLLLHTIYYPFVMYANRREGIALQAVVKGSGYISDSYGYVNNVDTSAILNNCLLNVFLVNRSMSESSPVVIDLVGHRLSRVESAEVLTGPHAKACNTYEQPLIVSSQPFRAVQIQNGKAVVELPSLSVTALTFEIDARRM